MFLEKINSPKDVKKLRRKDLPSLCEEIRTALLQRLSKKGGHAGPNLGVVELTVALHYVFDAPQDKIVFDVSHQCYTHKMLTGRKQAFLYEQCYGQANGFTNPLESAYDLFTVGHTSTAISLACGLAKARDLLGQKHNVVAVVGDGSLSGGEAYEGLNNIAEQGTNFIAVINDNEMSIAENHGGYAKNLGELRRTKGKAKHNMFLALGLDYLYEEQGNDVNRLVNLFRKVKDCSRPVAVHLHTQKGKGYLPAEQNTEKFHSCGPFCLQTGEILKAPEESYNSITRDYLQNKTASDKSVFVISSGTPAVLALDAPRREAMGKNFVDVGIAEEHAVAFASGAAKGGAKPVYAVFGSFLQRSFDQLHQDLALDNNPAVILSFWDSVYGMGGATHNGLYDVAELSNIPNLLYLAPTCVEEYLAMLDWAIDQTQRSVAIRVPAKVYHGSFVATDYSAQRSVVTKKGSGVAILAVGSMYRTAEQAAELLAQKGVHATLVNPVCLTSVDEKMLNELAETHSLIVTVEEGILDGGYGQKVASLLGDKDVKVKNFGLEKSFFGDFVPDELLARNGLTAEQIAAYISDFKA